MALEGGSSGHCQHLYQGMSGWSRAGGHLGTPAQHPRGTSEPRHLRMPPGPGRVGAHIQHLQLPWAPPVPPWSRAEDAQTCSILHPTWAGCALPREEGSQGMGTPLYLQLLQFQNPSPQLSQDPLPQHGPPQNALIRAALRRQNKFLSEAGVLHTPRDVHARSQHLHLLRAENIIFLPVPSTARLVYGQSNVWVAASTALPQPPSRGWGELDPQEQDKCPRGCCSNRSRWLCSGAPSLCSTLQCSVRAT